ncbi:hypothetical protein PoB_002510100 [Plakobranchus ocellatus]|uniref:Uncharacterized protein n=1 Tax=Plakobranchus ocellatus TaxID=259542 RepID=A0AAV3ZRK5_9GAST|nr:hypothetical protein PoB_002510100 [Plakobranchus ocellatus]
MKANKIQQEKTRVRRNVRLRVRREACASENSAEESEIESLAENILKPKYRQPENNTRKMERTRLEGSLQSKSTVLKNTKGFCCGFKPVPLVLPSEDSNLAIIV